MRNVKLFSRLPNETLLERSFPRLAVVCCLNLRFWKRLNNIRNAHIVYIFVFFFFFLISKNYFDSLSNSFLLHALHCFSNSNNYHLMDCYVKDVTGSSYVIELRSLLSFNCRKIDHYFVRIIQDDTEFKLTFLW